MPPPKPYIVSPPPALLPLIRVRVTVRLPALSIPPPAANAHSSTGTEPHGAGEEKVDFGSATFPAMTLSLIITAGPVELSGAESIFTPPPAANPGESLRPPVIVTPLIETVGFTAPNPIVITGPPPSMVVAPADAPTRARSLSIVIPPAYVPERT